MLVTIAATTRQEMPMVSLVGVGAALATPWTSLVESYHDSYNASTANML